MALNHREEVVVGKRFLALKTSKQKSSTTAREWLAGVIRAASDTDLQSKDFQVLVEVDNVDWQTRDWLKINEECSVFLIEDLLVLAQRTHPEKNNKKCWWPALTFQSVVDQLGVTTEAQQPIEFLADHLLTFQDTSELSEYKETSRNIDPIAKQTAQEWQERQDGQSILVTTPTVLVGYRVKVYRSEGATQWYTAVIQHYNDSTKELTLLDDTVLEEHNESAELTQIIPLDGVVESILKGTDTRITPRRSRACKEGVSKEQGGTNPTAATAAQHSSTVSSQSNSKNKQYEPGPDKPSATRSQHQTTSQVNKTLSQTTKSQANKTAAPSSEKTDCKSGKGPSITSDSKKSHTSVIKRNQRASDKRKAEVSPTLTVNKTASESKSTLAKEPTNKRNASTNKGEKSVATSIEKPVKKSRKRLPAVITNNSEVKPAKSKASRNISESAAKDVTAESATASHSDMHIKKLRILGANSSETNSQVSPAAAENHAPGLPKYTPSTPTSIAPRTDKLSEGGDCGSSGYSSATTADTVSPRTGADGRRSTTSTQLPPPVTSPVSQIIKPTSTSTAKVKQADRLSNTSSPRIMDAGKEPGIEPYRDPDLMKRDEESRRLRHSSLAPPTAATSVSASNLVSATPHHPAAALLNTTPLMNPAAAQQMSQLGLLQMSHLQQMAALHGMNPLGVGLFQQQQLAAYHQQLAQQQAMEALMHRQRPQLPHGLPPWGMMISPFGDKGLGDLQQDRLVSDQKERERLETERAAERERQDKDRLEREQKERRKNTERQERAKVVQESAAAAKAAVNQHFTESLKRVRDPAPHPTSVANWSKQGSYTASSQPQDLSMSSRIKAEHHLDTQERERFGQATSHLHLTDDKQKAFSRQQEEYLRLHSSQAQNQQKLAEEHFIKSLQQPKPEPAEYNLYGYQSFPNRFVSKDQLQQQLIKNESKERLSSHTGGASREERLRKHSPLSGVKNSLPSSRQQAEQKRKESPPSTTMSYSKQIQDGLIPNPAYIPSSTAGSNTSNSISALIDMSQTYAPTAPPDKHRRDKNSLSKTSFSVKQDTTAPSLYGRNGAATEQQQQQLQPQNSSEPTFMKSFKSFVETAVTNAFYKDIEEQKKKSPASDTSLNSNPKTERTNGNMDTDSDTLSAPSPTLSVKTDDNKAFHPKMRGKKEWAQRHSTEGGGTTPPSPGVITPPSPSVTLSMTSTMNGSTNSIHSETTTSASEAEAELRGSTQKSKKRKSDSHLQTNGQKKAKNYEVSSADSKIGSSSAGVRVKRSGVTQSSGAGGDNSTLQDEQSSMERLAEIASHADRIDVPYANKPLVRVHISTLKKTGQPFVQDGSCIEMAPKLTKCRECKMTPNQRNKKMPNIFCRFYAFRRLKFSRSSQISIAGFCEPSDADEDDIRIWLPYISPEHHLPISQNEVENAKYIVANVGDEFCRLVEQELECATWANADCKRVWKRAVQGVREMCDVCDTTLFNTHWVCHRCGFVVCIDCYRVKRKITAQFSNNANEENRRWLTCASNKNHEPDKLMLTSIIPGNALNVTGELIHRMRKKHGIPSNCLCGRGENSTAGKNGVSQHLLNAVAVSKHSLVNGNSSTDSKLSMSCPVDTGYQRNAILTSSLDQKALNSYSDDPLSLLADVATHNLQNLSSGKQEIEEVNGMNSESLDGTEDVEKKTLVTLRNLLTKQQNNASVNTDSKVHDLISTVVETDVSQPGYRSQGLLSPGGNQLEFAHYQRRSGAYLSGRTAPIPICTLTETSLRFPDVRHSWLCEGRLLQLLDAQKTNNFPLFNERWRLGQPIIVSNVTKGMKLNELWTPQAFSKEFGHIKHDLIDCRRNEPLTGYQIKCFWDGFEDSSKRLRDSDGEPIILKLKDWPTAEDFAESMPTRFTDLMQALPIPEYTRRNGCLNLAGRLPDFFVKPDLGPKMYIAYGLARFPDNATTNLHLDVSDAVNVMVYTAQEKELTDYCLQLIEQSDCDPLMKRRVIEGGEIPGALWHIYDACDADKMRDLLNKVAMEEGMDIEPYHDPIHDQQFYLDANLRKRLADEYDVHGYAIIQCAGDAVFIPAGAPHQVQNLNGCIKVAEDFLSPEHMHHCFNLTQEFRHLSNTHSNHEDKLQVKNMIYHAIKYSVAVLDKSKPL